VTIYVTTFDPNTKQVTACATDSGFESIEQVVEFMGPPLAHGKRTATYRTMFYSDYCLTQKIPEGQKLFLNRNA
jgi:hypothetical protein